MSEPAEMSSNASVPGERSTPVINSVRSMQSRISSFLAAGLMIALGLGGLSWYYTNALSRQKRARQAAMTAATNSAQGEMALPPLGTVESAQTIAPGVPVEPAARQQRIAEPPSVVPAPDLPLAVGGSMAPYTAADPYRSPQRRVAGDRRLSGAAFARESAQSSSATAAPADGQDAGGVAIPVSQAVMSQLPGQLPAPGGGDGLATLLRPGMTTPARAQMLPTQQFLLPKGAFIDCTLETAIDSTLPGMTTCVTATDTFGADGKVVLLERGSKLVGETRGEVQNGAARVFVLWTEARTPTGVLVPLDSPGTDELGRAGLPGEVNRHFWDRFGAALLISVVDGAMQAAVQSSSRGSGAIIYNPAGSQEALTDVLKGTINIAPTVTKHQGDRIQILVARDLDFRPVYELRAGL
jgi:type IV secretion system protein VirB10